MNKEVKNIISLSVSVLLVIATAYFMSSIFITKEYNSSKSKTTTEAKTYDNLIMAGKTFSISDDKYLVLFFSSNKISDELKNAIDGYSNSDIKLYNVNLDEGVNSYVKSKKDNKNPTDSSELKIKDIALIAIENKKVISFESNEEKIIENLK